MEEEAEEELVLPVSTSVSSSPHEALIPPTLLPPFEIILIQFRKQTFKLPPGANNSRWYPGNRLRTKFVVGTSMHLLSWGMLYAKPGTAALGQGSKMGSSWGHSFLLRTVQGRPLPYSGVAMTQLVGASTPPPPHPRSCEFGRKLWRGASWTPASGGKSSQRQSENFIQF